MRTKEHTHVNTHAHLLYGHKQVWEVNSITRDFQKTTTLVTATLATSIQKKSNNRFDFFFE